MKNNSMKYAREIGMAYGLRLWDEIQVSMHADAGKDITVASSMSPTEREVIIAALDTLEKRSKDYRQYLIRKRGT